MRGHWTDDDDGPGTKNPESVSASGVCGILASGAYSSTVTSALSRAEAAVRDGGLDAALGEIAALPEDVQTVMQDWLDDARARNAALQAAQDLSQSLTAN